MCGRYATTANPATLAVELDAINETGESDGPESADYNVAPTTQVLTVVARHDREDPDSPATRRIRRMRWGLVPSYATEPGKGAPLFNARSETVATKAAFKTSLRFKRCLVPMDGWYEWQTEPTPDGKAVKVPYYMARGDGQRLFMAGLWAVWHDPKAPKSPPLLSTTILTTDSVDQLANVHDRMPLILPPDRWDAWLDPDSLGHPDLIAPSLESVAAVEIRRVSTKVNSVRNNGPDLLDPDTGDRAGEQISLL
ncbi:SOS response-associated peptidase [Rhodococcus sp. TAF43]|uniref:SOS response-associated peptidase n=1 Tax=unclassified Rhodococcus (in: high G+C Gram-positive bacteria) TaxID=192944 RepID=UPI000E0AB4D1|nr:MULTISPECIES: SOS response-associated peptidase [unclassified Rhodococcus (in: high G+C Gram-positive bacteria)]QKT12526.1 SOS response-associated peptidase [Rhodococcus sp. W8901]RDI25779.1 putative SOS response-associated peptidase YedK [Rhodococcus sp. AG1013]